MLTETRYHQDYSERVAEVKQYIREHIDEPLNRDVLAAVAGFSIPHFHRIFKAQIGTNVVSYVRRVRMERAGRKLRMGAVDIIKVAISAGYNSHAAFSKAFKRQYGFSPSKFRELDCRAATQLLRKG